MGRLYARWRRVGGLLRSGTQFQWCLSLKAGTWCTVDLHDTDLAGVGAKFAAGGFPAVRQVRAEPPA